MFQTRNIFGWLYFFDILLYIINFPNPHSAILFYTILLLFRFHWICWCCNIGFLPFLFECFIFLQWGEGMCSGELLILPPLIYNFSFTSSSAFFKILFLQWIGRAPCSSPSSSFVVDEPIDVGQLFAPALFCKCILYLYVLRAECYTTIGQANLYVSKKYVCVRISILVYTRKK